MQHSVRNRNIKKTLTEKTNENLKTKENIPVSVLWVESYSSLKKGVSSLSISRQIFGGVVRNAGQYNYLLSVVITRTDAERVAYRAD